MKGTISSTTDNPPSLAQKGKIFFRWKTSTPYAPQRSAPIRCKRTGTSSQPTWMRTIFRLNSNRFPRRIIERIFLCALESPDHHLPELVFFQVRSAPPLPGGGDPG